MGFLWHKVTYLFIYLFIYLLIYLSIYLLTVSHKCLAWLEFIVNLLILCRHNAIWNKMLTLSPSFIPFTSCRSPSLSNSRSSGLGECRFFCGGCALQGSSIWQLCFLLHLGSQRPEPDAVPVADCMSAECPAWCHNPVLTIVPQFAPQFLPPFFL